MYSVHLDIKLRPLFSTVILFVVAATKLAAVDQVQPFPLGEVRLLDSPFKQAQERDLQYMLKLEPDRLLAPFRREAGLPKKAEPYGNW